jgi:hypothetical protein
MHQGADTAEALGKCPGFSWIAPFQYGLNPPDHGAGTGCTGDLAIAVHARREGGGLCLNPQVALDPGYRVYDDFFHGDLIQPQAA